MKTPTAKPKPHSYQWPEYLQAFIRTGCEVARVNGFFNC